MLLVALFFMHVRHSTKLTKLVLLGALLWLMILLGLLTMAISSPAAGSASPAGKVCVRSPPILAVPPHRPQSYH